MDVLDLRDPAHPILHPPLESSRLEMIVGMFVHGTSLYINTKVPVAEEAERLVRVFVQQMDLSDPSHPAIHAPINIPGSLITINDHGLGITRDFVPDPTGLDPMGVRAIHQVQLLEGKAHLNYSITSDNSHIGHSISHSYFDGEGLLLVPHQERLLILSVTNHELPILYDGPMPQLHFWGQAVFGKALIRIGSNKWLLSLDDPNSPHIQTQLPASLHGMVKVGSDTLIPAGRHGLLRITPDTFQLQEMNTVP